MYYNDILDFQKGQQQNIKIIPYSIWLHFKQKSCRFRTISSCHNISFLFGVEYILSTVLTSDYIQKSAKLFLASKLFICSALSTLRRTNSHCHIVLLSLSLHINRSLTTRITSPETLKLSLIQVKEQKNKNSDIRLML